jgi:hypothetical protein
MSVWVMSLWRRHRLATVALAIAAGLAGGVVAGSFQSARRSATALDRSVDRTHVYDDFVIGCPPGIDPSKADANVIEHCATDEVASRFRREVLDHLPQVVRSSVGKTAVVGVLDSGAASGWGRGGIMVMGESTGVPITTRPIVVRGRLPRERATNEVTLTEAASRAVHAKLGDRIRIGSWRPAEIDRAVAGTLPPDRNIATAKVVGVVRTYEDVTPGSDGLSNGNLSDVIFPDEIIAGPGWWAAHGRDIASYGTGVEVALRPGAQGLFRRPVHGWNISAQPLSDPNAIASLKRFINVQTQATMLFGLIALLASGAFITISVVRQLRREFVDAATLSVLGVSRRQLAAGGLLRTLSIGVPAAVIAVVVAIALSPLGPVGLARRLDASHPVRIDLPVLGGLILGLVVLFAAIGVVTPLVAPRRNTLRTRSANVTRLSRPLGPVAWVGATFARGRHTIATVAVAAVAIATFVGAGVLVASFDDVAAHPARFGAWWDLVVGDFSSPASLHAAEKVIRSDSFVAQAATVDPQNSVATLDRRPFTLIAATPVVGRPEPVISTGYAPNTRHEIALGTATARKLGKTVGDTVMLGAAGTNHASVPLHVVGIAVIDDPIDQGPGAGDGAIVTGATLHSLVPSIPQSITVRLRSGQDQSRGLAQLRKQFPTTIRGVVPETDILDLQRLRVVPWLISLLVGVLALATMIYALISTIAVHRRDLAVLAALGLNRRQRYETGLCTALYIAAAGVVVGVPVGLIAGNQLWRIAATGVDIPPGSIPAGMAATVVVVVGVGALIAAGAVGAACSIAVNRRSPGQLLRADAPTAPE